MKLHVLGSSSAGNCYLLTANNGETLVIEAGVPFSDVKKARNFNISTIVGCLISHSHGDHAGYAMEFAKAGIHINTNAEAVFKISGSLNTRNFHCAPCAKLDIGSFKVRPFRVVHDVDCYGYLIGHSEMGTAVFITDTHYVPNTFPGLNNIIVECNYSEEILEANISAGKLPAVVRNRVLNSHMSLETLKGFLTANDLTAVNNIVLTHLSDGNSNARGFKKEIQELTGKAVHIADKNLIINFNKTPF